MPVIGPIEYLGYAEGRGIGGGSCHNYQEAVRGASYAYDEWAALSGSDQWSYNNMLPLFKALETYTPDGNAVDHQQRGTHGPIRMTQTNTLAQVQADPVLSGMATTGNVGYRTDINNAAEVTTTGLVNVGVSPYGP
jgi:choline dehydrogenase-like flavoprotein